MNDKYRPSNGTEGIGFQERYCFRCKNDDEEKGKLCDILTRTYAFDVDDPRYPEEWTYKDGKPVCTAFQDVDTPEIEPRCKHTLEMFKEA
jgi:hypothetical protein